jgi:hypothetical protein
MTVRILYRHGLYEVLSSRPWRDSVAGIMTDYLAGFLTEQAARDWCAAHGYEVA